MSASKNASTVINSTNFLTLPARERILVTARELFYRDGLRAIGIDRIIAEASVAKLTFYRHFPSKNHLIQTFLEDRHQRWMAWFIDALGRHGAVAGGGLAPLQKALAEWFHQPVFRGCAFINAVAEMGSALPVVVQIAKRHKQEMQQVIAGLLPAGRGHTATSARALALTVAADGAMVRAQIDGADAALAALQQLIHALEPPRSARSP
jgi:AcrR family transcriptional regulator